MDTTSDTTRRRFVEQVAAGALAVGVSAASPGIALAETSREDSATSPKPDDGWLRGVQSSRSQIFDMPAPNEGFPLFHVRNYLHSYRDAYEMVYPRVLAIVGLYGFTTPMGFNDAMWAKFGFGAATGVNDRSTKAPAVRNVFAAAGADGSLGVDGRIEVPGDSSIAALQQVGARFILCSNAFNFWSARLAAATGRTARDVRVELEANMLPGIIIVPAMVVAVNQAQRAGATYMYLA